MRVRVNTHMRRVDGVHWKKVKPFERRAVPAGKHIIKSKPVKVKMQLYRDEFGRIVPKRKVSRI